MKKVYHHALPQPIGLWMTMRGPSLRKLSRTKEVWRATKSREAAINKHIQTLVAIHAIWKLRWCKLRSLVSTKGFWAKVLHIRFHQWSDAGILCDKILGTAYHGSNVTPTRAGTQKPCHFKHSMSCPFSWTTGFHPNLVGTFVIHVRLEMMSAMSSRLWASRRRALAPSSHEET